MVRHYITKYREGGELWCEAWLQLNILGWCWCFSRRRIKVD